MKLKNSKSVAVVVSALMGSSSMSLAAEAHKFKVYGGVTAGLMSVSVDPEGGSKTSMTGLTQGAASPKLGVTFAPSSKLSGKVELSASLGDTSADPEVKVRKSVLTADVGAGKLSFGRQGRLFDGVAAAADNFTFASGEVYGTVSGASRSTGIVYDATGLAGPAKIKLGLFNPAGGAGTKEEGKSPMADIEFSAGADLGMFGFDLAVFSQSEKYNPTVVDGATVAGDKYSVMTYSVSATAKISKVDAAVVYTGGDAVNAGGILTKDNKDTVSALALHLSADVAMVNLGFYYGMTTLTKVKDNYGAEKDVDDKNTTMGIGVGYNFNDVDYRLEYAADSMESDGTKLGKVNYIGLSATAEFSA